jgi:hypothetical protein
MEISTTFLHHLVPYLATFFIAIDVEKPRAHQTN